MRGWGSSVEDFVPGLWYNIHMNKTLIRIFAFIILISPWIYVSSVYKEVFYIFAGIGILLATVNIEKKKKVE